MLRNLPNNYTREMLLQLLNNEGFQVLYDLLYLPMDFKTGVSMGYAFVNMVDLVSARNLWHLMDGYSRWVIPSRKQSGVSWSSVQGLEANIERYQRSAIMGKDIPIMFKPLLFADGEEIPFPKRRAVTRQTNRRAKCSH